MKSLDYIRLAEEHSARNYLPLPVVLAKGEGVWVEDVEGKRYLDMLSSYSALNTVIQRFLPPCRSRWAGSV